MKTLRSVFRFFGVLLYGLNFLFLILYFVRVIEPSMALLIEVVLILLSPTIIFIVFKITPHFKKNHVAPAGQVAFYIGLLLFAPQAVVFLSLGLFFTGFLLEGVLSKQRPDASAGNGSYTHFDDDDYLYSTENVYGLNKQHLLQNVNNPLNPMYPFN